MDGTYIPLWSDGSLKRHICAFARQGEDKVVLVIVPRFLTRLIQSVDDMPLGKQVWGDSAIVLPDEIPGNRFRNILTGEATNVLEWNGKKGLAFDQVFANFPVAMLEAI